MEKIQEAVVSGNVTWLSKCLALSSHCLHTPIDDENTTLLHLAANSSSSHALRLLLHHGADVDCQNEDGLTALHVAAMWGREEAVALLLESGSDPFISDEDDLLPLDYALNEGHTECVLLLQNQELSFLEASSCDQDMSMAEAFVSMFLDDDLTLLIATPPMPTEELEESPSTPRAADSTHLSHNNSTSSITCVVTHTITDIISSINTCIISPASAGIPSPTYTGSTSPASPGTTSPASTRNPSPTSTGISSLTCTCISSSSSTGTTSPTNTDVTSFISPSTHKTSSLTSHLLSSPNSFGTLTISDQPTRRELFPSEYEKNRMIVKEMIDNSSFYQSALEGFLEDNDSKEKKEPNSTDGCVRVQVPQRILKMSNKELRDRLLSLGERPGPINNFTRSTYQTYLAKIQAGIQPSGNSGYRGYKYELALVLNGTVAVSDLDALEELVVSYFHTSSTPTISTMTSMTPRALKKMDKKDHFNYLLLDPLVLDRLKEPSGCSGLDSFRVFVDALFYVGKGKDNRSMQHLKDARDCKEKTPMKVSRKLRTILDLWDAGRGVISLQIFHNTTSEEAFTREACLIDAIGIDMLTNVQRGHVYGNVCGWRMCKRRKLGVHLLHKAFRTYQIHMPQELFLCDL